MFSAIHRAILIALKLSVASCTVDLIKIGSDWSTLTGPLRGKRPPSNSEQAEVNSNKQSN